jgi:hypothetical protein
MPIASDCNSQSLVLPSISVNKVVTVPEGRFTAVSALLKLKNLSLINMLKSVDDGRAMNGL